MANADRDETPSGTDYQLKPSSKMIEDIDDYRGFEAAVIAGYDACAAVERELVLRLASLLWRLRRATAIETDLLRIEAEVLRDRRYRRVGRPQHQTISIFGEPPLSGQCEDTGNPSHACPDPHDHVAGSATYPLAVSRELAYCFLRLANLDNGVFERLGRYESALSRQVARILFLLKSARAR
jgi:hypothetical protein